jgi:4-hydroxy-tetrahydrodipicolinate reductase
VIGTSGLTASDYAEIDQAARSGSVGVVAAGNFSLTAAVCQAAALLAARHLPHWEVIDYTSATKPDFRAARRENLPIAWERSGRRRSAIRSPSSTGHRKPGARRSAAPKSIRSASRASWSPPRSYSACPTSV